MGTILNSKHVSGLIEECIIDLKQGVGSRMSDLALLTHTLAQATGEAMYFLMPQVIGRLGNEIGLFHSLVDTPILEPKMRGKFQKILDTSVNEISGALKSLKKELSKGATKADYHNIVECIATFEKNCYILRENRTALVERARGPPRPRGLQT